MALKSATASEVAKNFGAYLDAAKTGPVRVTKHDRPAAYLLSPEEYDRLVSLQRRAVKVEDMDAEWLEAIARAKTPPEEDYDAPDFKG